MPKAKGCSEVVGDTGRYGKKSPSAHVRGFEEGFWRYHKDDGRMHLAYWSKDGL